MSSLSVIIHVVFLFLFDRKAPYGLSSEFLLDFVKVFISDIVFLHRLLILPDTRPMTEQWQSAGRSVESALISQTGKDTLCICPELRSNVGEEA
jgi:hypothetical protein